MSCNWAHEAITDSTSLKLTDRNPLPDGLNRLYDHMAQALPKDSLVMIGPTEHCFNGGQRLRDRGFVSLPEGELPHAAFQRALESIQSGPGLYLPPSSLLADEREERRAVRANPGMALLGSRGIQNESLLFRKT